VTPVRDDTATIDCPLCARPLWDKDYRGPIVPCAACGRLHPGHCGGSREPHYCSLVCFYQGHGIEDRRTGDAAKFCPACKRSLRTKERAELSEEVTA